MNKRFLLLWLCGIVFSIFAYNSIAAQSCGSPCIAEAGVAIPPVNTTYTLGATTLSEPIQGFSVEPMHNSPNFLYNFIITQNIDTSGNGDFADIIVGVTDEYGVFDFTELGVGTFMLTGFVYCDSELDGITSNGTIHNLLPCLSGGETMPEVIACMKASGLAGTIHQVDSILHVAALPFILGFAPCVDVADVSYSISVEQAVACDGDNCEDTPYYLYPDPEGPTSYGPYSNLCATAGATDPEVPACFGEPTGSGDAPEINNSLWLVLAGDGNYYHIYTSKTDVAGNSVADYIDGGDSQMAIYAGECGGLTLLDCNEDDVAHGAGSADYFSGLEIQTEAGVFYYILIDGFNFYDTDGTAYLSDGEFYVNIEPTEPPMPCTANIENGFTDTVVELCSDETFTLSVNNNTLDFGPNEGTTPLVIWTIHDANPGLDSPLDSPSFIGFVLVTDTTTNEFNISGNAAGDSTYWIVPLTVAQYNPGGGANTFQIDNECFAWGTPVQVVLLADGEGDCPSPIDCSAANLNLLDGSPTSISLCPGSSGAIMLDSLTANWGPNAADTSSTPVVAWLVTAESAGGQLPANTDILNIIVADSYSLTLDHPDTTNSFYITPITAFLSSNGDLGIDECVQVAASVMVTFLDSTDPACDTGNNCLAEAGVVSAPADLDYTIGETTQAPLVEGNYVGDGYLYVYVLTTDLNMNDGIMYNIVGYSADGVFNTSNLAPGTYNVHGLSFNGTVDDLLGLLSILQASGNDNGEYLAEQIAAGTVCADLLVPGYSFSVSEPLPDPISIMGPTVTDNGDGTYKVEFMIMGGDGTYLVNGNEINGEAFSANISCGTDYNYIVSDGVQDAVQVSGIAPCAAPCTTSAGTMSQEQVTVCADGTVSGTASDFSLGVGDVLVYALHTSAGTLPGVVLGIDKDGSNGGSFMFAELLNPAYNTLYFLSAIAGPDEDGDGVPDFNNECTKVAEGTPVVFVQPLVISAFEDCNNDASAIIHVEITGGYPSYDPSGTYTVTGAVNTDLASFEFSVDEGEQYDIIVQDDLGCSTEVHAVNNCVKCKDNAGTLTSSDLQIVCSTDQATVSAQDFELNAETNSQLAYGLYSTSTPTKLTIPLALSLNGSFSFSSIPNGAYNTEYYVVSIAGPDADQDSYPDLTAGCTEISTSVAPVVFLAPISIDADYTCDHATGLGTVIFTVSGGLPQYDNTNTYSIVGSFTGTYAFGGAPLVISNIPDGGTYTITASDGYCTSKEVSQLTQCLKTPITWGTFSGEVLASGNNLKWNTLSETNNDYFSVQRSTDGNNFTEIAIVNAAGNTIVNTNYQYLDKTAPIGTSYYRLVQFDNNGTSENSKTINLTRGAISFGIGSITPIPAKNYVEITYNVSKNEPVSLTIYDLTGKLMFSDNIVSENGLNTYSLDIADYASGIYFVSIKNDKQIATERFIKE